MSSLTQRPAVELLSMLREKKISSLELAEEHIRTIEQLNPQLNALIDFDPERVREQARNAKPGSLSGLPLTIKTTISTAGHRCEVGSLLNRGDHRHRRRSCRITLTRRWRGNPRRNQCSGIPDGVRNR